MHPDADAFLDAIFDSPDDDTPRLVYADWLQEHDQENYAQFIRLQCAAAREPFWSPEANRLWEEIGRVWTRLDDEWWPATREHWEFVESVEDWSPSRGFVRVRGLSRRRLDAVHFDRGFLTDRAVFDAQQLLDYHPLWPVLPTSRLTLYPDMFRLSERLAALPLLRRVRHLRFAPGHGTHLGDFLDSPYLTRLQVIDLSRVPVDAFWTNSLAESPYLSAVQEVRLSTRYGDAGDDPEAVVSKLQERFPRVIRQ